MNSFIKIFFLVVFLSLDINSQDCKSNLIITTDIPLVNIFINDSLISNDGKAEIELAEGVYVISVEEISDKWNSKIFIDTIRIFNCESEKLNYKFKSDVLINSVPQDAYVFYQDSLLGFTPLKLNRNLNSIMLSKPGYYPRQVSLSEVGSSPVKLDFAGFEKPEPFVSTSLFKFLTGSAVLLGAATAYFKLKADDKFDEYRFSGNKKYLDETNRFDTISGISLALFQINFGYIIYRFLAE